MSAHIYGTTWPVEMQEMMKDAFFLFDSVDNQSYNPVRKLDKTPLGSS